MTLIDLSYRLYRLTNGKYERAEGQDAILEAQLASQDTYPKVDQVADPKVQSEIVDYHVTDIFYEVPVGDYELGFPLFTDSKWNSATKNWDKPYLGASVIYRVYRDGDDVGLYLAVATSNVAA